MFFFFCCRVLILISQLGVAQNSFSCLHRLFLAIFRRFVCLHYFWNKTENKLINMIYYTYINMLCLGIMILFNYIQCLCIKIDDTFSTVKNNSWYKKHHVAYKHQVRLRACSHGKRQVEIYLFILYMTSVQSPLVI